MRYRFLIILFSALVKCGLCNGQTAFSLFHRSDSIQVNEFVAYDNKQYSQMGHHGPAVENELMALRIYFNDSGAIDVYSKSQSSPELRKYLWYPTDEQMREENAGCDEYFVGKTLGLGGIGLWDGERVVKLKMTESRKARVGKTAGGSFAELTSYGVPYKDGKVDISIRVDVFRNSCFAKVTAQCLSGEKVCFVTGVNYNEGAEIITENGIIGVWGTHPANVSLDPIPIGGGMLYNPKTFPYLSRTGSMVRLISVPARKVSTRVISSSTKKPGMDAAAFFSMLRN